MQRNIVNNNIEKKKKIIKKEIFRKIFIIRKLLSFIFVRVCVLNCA